MNNPTGEDESMSTLQYPVLEIADQLKEQLVNHPVVIVEAPPGGGKSTVLPLELAMDGRLPKGKILLLEPRRLAARAVAERMSQLSDESVGGLVGYRVRFETRVSSATRIEVVTEGILTRMIQNDNALSDYSLIIFDEFHERSLHADLALTLTLQIQQVLRPELRILIMSATLDTGGLSAKLGDAPVVSSKGRQYPVEVCYAPSTSDTPLPTRVAGTIQKVCLTEPGDVLVFLPGAGEIKRVAQILEERQVEAVVQPLFGDLPFAKQQEALLPRRDGLRKVVLSTAIAETSLTIEGIRIVIDSGLARVPRFDPRSGLTKLETIRVTRDAADQRAGRAGRLGPGLCYRLWTQGENLSLVDQRKPEILEADLATLMLELLQWGVRNPAELTWVTPPPGGAVAQALDLLQNLRAFDGKAITPRGKQLLQLPTHPRLAQMLLQAEEESPEALSLATDLAALLEERDPVEREAGADIGLRVEALRKWREGRRVFGDRTILERIEKLAANWRRITKSDLDNGAAPDRLIGKLLWAAYPERLARQTEKNGNRFKLSTGKNVVVAPHDPLIRETLICAAQLDAGKNEGKVFLAAPVHLEDLREFASDSVTVRWDEEKAMVVCTQEKKVGTLVLESKPVHGAIDEEKRLGIIAEQARLSELRIFGDVESRLAFQSRVYSLHCWRQDDGWPPMTDEFILAHIEEWLAPFLGAITRKSELEKLDVPQMLNAFLPWELQQKLDLLAPTRIQVPSGSMIQVRYSQHGEPPIMEVRLQEMFGLSDTPTVNEGRTKVKLHLLSPGFKPVQVTQDLRSFWETTYHEVRKELRMRYPRHHWPEDPWTAEAVRGAKRRRE